MMHAPCWEMREPVMFTGRHVLKRMAVEFKATRGLSALAFFKAAVRPRRLGGSRLATCNLSIV